MSSKTWRKQASFLHKALLIMFQQTTLQLFFMLLPLPSFYLPPARCNWLDKSNLCEVNLQIAISGSAVRDFLLFVFQSLGLFYIWCKINRDQSYVLCPFSPMLKEQEVYTKGVTVHVFIRNWLVFSMTLTSTVKIVELSTYSNVRDNNSSVACCAHGCMQAGLA